ncbi:MAG: hypothetical protein Q8M07_01075 [Prosthecobacter sp.]|nr:hypothetical protein [Prosthecobacter sp.]
MRLVVVGLAGRPWMRTRVVGELLWPGSCVALVADPVSLAAARLAACQSDDGSGRALLVLMEVESDAAADWLRYEGGQVVHLNYSARLSSDEPQWPALMRGCDVVVRGDAPCMAQLIREMTMEVAV